MVKDPLKYFRPEAHDLLEKLGTGILELEKDSSKPDIVQRVLRFAHTLKGAARVVKQTEIAERAHAIEDALTPFRESTAAVAPARIDAVLGLLDEIRDRLSALPPGPSTGHAVPDDGIRTFHTAVGEMDALLEGVTEAHAQLSAFRPAIKLIDRARDLADALAKQLDVRESRNGSTLQAPFAGRLRKTVLELREVVGGLERHVTSGCDHMDRELGQLRQAVEQLRLVPARTMFPVLERTVRDAAQAVTRSVRFESSGGDVRVEAHVLAAVQRALVQVVRNAVAHGIEPEAVRKAQGKPPQGVVTIAVTQRGRRVVFRARDDGRGVDLEAVRRVTAQRGLSESETRSLGPEELVRLLLQGGISTSPEVTDVAGRGIGLDIVRAVAEEVGGEVAVVTQASEGTTFELVVPISLASVEALIVEAGGVCATIPLDSVRQTLRVTAAEITRSAHGASVVHQGRVIPFIQLQRPLGTSSAIASAGSVRSAIVLEGRDGIAAVGVDRCIGTARIVTRPLPRFTPADAIVGGVCLDAEGNPQIVLDPDALVREAANQDTIDVVPEPVRQAPLLVIDDSLTTRMLEQSILESAGYDVDAVMSAEEALERARRKAYALFLVDVEMPGMDGFRFIECVRSDPVLRSVPAILVTSRSSAEDRQRGHDLGAQGYIVKSDFNQAELLARIKQLVQ